MSMRKSLECYAFSFCVDAIGTGDAGRSRHAEWQLVSTGVATGLLLLEGQNKHINSYIAISRPCPYTHRYFVKWRNAVLGH